ncbi:MAG: DUF4126 domain-containing protein, partial [Mariniphaga sp.]|nr:DUF4126 domain-containing protein [Mariniphaga sp.]
ARFGFLELGDNFAWLSSSVALLSLSVASVVEILAYYIPFVDNLLDTVAMPLAVGAGTLLAASVLPSDNNFYRWVLAIIIGGGASAVVQGTTSMLRLGSSGTTAGVGNAVVSTGENVASASIPVVTIIAPLLVATALVLLFIYMIRRVFRRKNVR